MSKKTDDRGPVRDGWCCWECADLAEATLPAEFRSPGGESPRWAELLDGSEPVFLEVPE